jgi:aspartyl protease family protein
MPSQYEPHPKQAHHCLPRRSERKPAARWRFLFYPLLLIVAILVIKHRLQWQPPHTDASIPTTSDSAPLAVAPMHAPPPQQPLSQPASLAVSGGLRMQMGPDGHFRGTLQINGVSMPFLVDTGATFTTIPINLANSAHLPPGHGVEANTAGGTVYSQITLAQSLKIGNAELHNAPVMTNPYLNEVLLGMSTLRYFKMTQSGAIMTLAAANNGEAEVQISDNEHPMPQPAPLAPNAGEQRNHSVNPNSNQWHKATVCDNGQNCRTVYGR